MSGVGEFKNLSTSFADKFKNIASDKVITKQELAELEAVQNQTDNDKKLLELLKSKTDESKFKVNVKEGSASGEYDLSIDLDNNVNNNPKTFDKLSNDFGLKVKELLRADRTITENGLKQLKEMPNKTAEDEEFINFIEGSTEYKNATVSVKDGAALFTYDLSMQSTSNNNTPTPTKDSPKTHEIIPGIISAKDNNSDITDGFEKLEVKAAGLPEQDMNNVKFQGYKQNTEFYSVAKANYLKDKELNLPPNTDVKKLQNYLTVKLGVNNPPMELKDGKFGPQTLEAFAKVYNQALKEGDTATIEALSPLMNTLATKFQGTKIGETLSKLSQQGASLIDTKAKVEADLNKAVEITSKSKDMPFEEAANQINNLQNIPDNTKLEFMKKIANNKAQQYVNEDTLSNKSDAEKLLKACSTPDGKSNGILDETTFTKLKEKVEGKKEEPNKPDETPKPDDKYAVTEQEKPHVDALSSLVTSPVKKGELKGREHVDAIGDNSSPRAKAVEAAFRALYHTVNGSDEKWKYSPNKESVGDVLKNKDIVQHLTADELKTLVNVYIDKGAKPNDLKEVFNSLDPVVSAKVMEGLKDSDNKDILLAMKPEDAAKILDKMNDEKLLKTFNEIGSGDWFFNVGDKTSEMGKILSNMSTEKIVKVLPKIKEEDPNDVLQAMDKGKACEVLKAMDLRESGKILSNIGKDAKSGEFISEIAKSDPKKAAEILNSMDKQKAEDVFEEMAGTDPKIWGSVLAELEKLDSKKAETFFDEIDRRDGKSSDLIKSQVQISKLIYLAEKGEHKEGLKGTTHLDRLRNSGNEADKNLVKEFEKHYEGKVVDGVVTWSKK